jgi:hypothetical protein
MIILDSLDGGGSGNCGDLSGMAEICAESARVRESRETQNDAAVVIFLPFFSASVR